MPKAAVRASRPPASSSRLHLIAERREKIPWPVEERRAALRYAWKTLAVADRRACLHVEDAFVVNTFVSGRTHLLREMRLQKSDDAAGEVLSRCGVMDVSAEVVEVAKEQRVVLSIPEAFLFNSEFPAYLLLRIPRTYGDYQEHLSRATSDAARVVFRAAPWWVGRTNAEICTFMARTFYLQIYYQLLSNIERRCCVGAGTPSWADRRQLRVSNATAAQYAARVAKTKVLRVLWDIWKDLAAGAETRICRVILAVWRAETTFAGASRRLDASLCSRRFVRATFEWGALRLPPGCILHVKNTFLVLDSIREPGGAEGYSAPRRPPLVVPVEPTPRYQPVEWHLSRLL